LPDCEFPAARRVTGIAPSLTARSVVPGLRFPSLVSAGLPLYSIFLQLESSQWLPAQSIAALQLRQLDGPLAHVCDSVPWYHDSLQAAGLVRGRPVVTATRCRLMWSRSSAVTWDAQSWRMDLLGQSAPGAP
jgi:hypothetical protein